MAGAEGLLAPFVAAILASGYDNGPAAGPAAGVSTGPGGCPSWVAGTVLAVQGACGSGQSLGGVQLGPAAPRYRGARVLLKQRRHPADPLLTVVPLQAGQQEVAQAGLDLEFHLLRPHMIT